MGQVWRIRYSIVSLLKIVTAFTIGHSVTLLIGALGWVRLPVQPVEILIAFSILVSSAHAIYPIFPGKEMYIAVGFGLIHGLAFSTVLANPNLGAGPMALSILGFNPGIEAMQLFVIVLIVPWLIILSRNSMYVYIRTWGAFSAGIISIAWIEERLLQKPNRISELATKSFQFAPWIIMVLALFALFTFYRVRGSGSFLRSSNE